MKKDKKIEKLREALEFYASSDTIIVGRNGHVTEAQPDGENKPIGTYADKVLQEVFDY